MKICYVLSKFPHTTEVFIHREIKELIKNGHEISVISLSPFSKSDFFLQDVSYPGNVTILKPSINPFSYLISFFWSIFSGTSVFLKLSHWKLIIFLIGKKNIFKAIYSGIVIDHFCYRLKNKSDEIAHFHSHSLFLCTYIASRISTFNKTPFSLTLHTTTYHFNNDLLKYILNKATFLRTISTELEPFFNKWIANASKFHYISNGVYGDEFMFNPISPSQNSFLILAVGSLLDKKGFDLLIEACSLLKNNDFPFSCEIYGEGPERNFLTAIIHDLNLTNEIKLMGHKPIDQIIRRMRQAQTLVMPSREPKRSTRDGLPTVIIEAMASKLPVIASSFAGIPDIVKHKQTGLIVPTDDYKAIANSIILLAYDNDLREKIINGGYEIAKNNYSISKSVNKLESLFNMEKQKN